MDQSIPKPPVATPVDVGETHTERKQRQAVDEGQILDEGLDLSGYRGTHGSPYVADYFQIRDYYQTNPEIASQVDEVTEYMIEKTEGESLVYAVKSILDEFKEQMNLSDEDTGLYRLKKVLSLIRAHRKLNQLDLLRQKAIADIQEIE